MLLLVVLLTVCMVEFFFFRTSILNISAVETIDGIGVYWDENCSLRVDFIDWGVLSLGEVREVVVYVRNEGNESCILVLTSRNWNPEDASRYLDLSWSRNNSKIGAGQIVKITQSLHVSPLIRGISSFSFDIIFMRMRWPDIDEDGDVDLYDAVILFLHYGAKEGDPNYDPNCDLNWNGKIDLYDAVILFTHYGEKDP